MSTAELRVRSVAEAADALAARGYRVSQGPRAATVLVGGATHPFRTVLTASEEGALIVTCHVASTGHLREADLGAFGLACLALNPEISPFAFALIHADESGKPDETHDWPIVLMDSLPLGHFTADDLGLVFGKLEAALRHSSPVLAGFFAAQ